MHVGSFGKDKKGIQVSKIKFFVRWILEFFAFLPEMFYT